MTEAELVEASTSYLDLMLSSLSLYMTVVSGYLLVAFFIGSKLTRAQLSLVSALYVFIAISATYGFFSWMMRGIGYAIKQEEINPSLKIYAGTPTAAAIAAVLLLGIIASLKFMWDIRHPKTE
jgi:hypothetical protein